MISMNYMFSLLRITELRVTERVYTFEKENWKILLPK
nr:MAG TPA: hypothetical protein [Caudoviricetes sp.]